ncbi:hypothetical protein Nepgr_012661 [Nepenthes gracilis]|uniref:Enhancer of polycomb-like protein n=1 Tax=Nepenthes gracilis TaxID=150966 RepID=A0AAD3SG59_NEPGR|nr:hypothetical protein Nepgr_012661 [Nepenthes gracilis]
MLMEHCTGDSHGIEVVKKSRSLDLHNLYGKKPMVSVDKTSILKSNCGPQDETSAKKKGKKEVLLSRLSYDKKSRKSLEELCYGGLSHLESGTSQKRSNCGLGGVSLNLNNKIIRVPKRPRDLVRRKKFDVLHGLEQEAASDSKGSFEPAAKSVGPVKLNIGEKSVRYTGDSNRKYTQNSECNGTSSGGMCKKVKHNKSIGGHKENRSNGFKSLQLLKEEDAHSCVYNIALPLKKARRNHKKRKDIGLGIHDTSEAVKTVFPKTVRICGDLKEDVEDNLEANATRMFSSRFDPTCAGFCSVSSSCKTFSANGLSFLVSTSRDLTSPLLNSETVSDTATRVLRPRDHCKRKRFLRMRRHFYEVSARDVDAYWLLNRRIKVFWPLDQSWYIGHVIGYDLEKNLHHIKYDDRDEEWIDLQNERFKLLVFPSEVPSKLTSKKSLRGDQHAEKAKLCGAVENDDHASGFMDSEPIISWIAKKQKTSKQSAKLQPSVSGGTHGITWCLNARSAERETNKPVCYSALPDLSGDSGRTRTSVIEKSNCHDVKETPIVYFRRRFRRNDQGVGDVPDCRLGHLPKENILWLLLDPDEFLQCADYSGLLKLTVLVDTLRLFRFELPAVPSYSFAVENLLLFHDLLLLNHGTMMIVWPIIHLEMFFVDNIVGLRYMLFEGCLRQAVAFVFLVLSVFHQSNEPWKHGGLHLPITSIWFRFSCLQNPRKQFMFAFCNFCETGDSKWLHLDHKLRRNCLLFKHLPASECTYGNIKALVSGSRLLPFLGVPSSRTDLEKIFMDCIRSLSERQPAQSAYSKLSPLTSNNDEKSAGLPPFALSFTATPTFFLALQIKLLVERGIPFVNFKDHDSLSLPEYPKNNGCLVGIDCSIVEGDSSRIQSLGRNLGVFSRDLLGFAQLLCLNSDLGNDGVNPCHDGGGMVTKLSHNTQDLEENDVGRMVQLERKEGSETEPKLCFPLEQDLDCTDGTFSVETKTGYCPLNGLTVEVPPFDPAERTAACGTPNDPHSSEVAWNLTDGVSCSPNSTAPRYMWHQNRIGSASSSLLGNMSRVGPDLKLDFIHSGFHSGPKKPRTQVSYSLPLGAHDFGLRNRGQHAKRFPRKLIRTASGKRSLDTSRSCQRNMELESCDANVLVTIGDRGWRECDAKIVLELFDHNEWRLAVKISGTTHHSYKAHQFFQPGSTNRYTHAMMWKGGQDWAVEFPDRTQWSLFKEMYEECYNRNMRAALVKNIPIPGVHLIEESDENAVEVPFVRPSSKYFQQVQTDVDMAMDASLVLYDMDSDDELWISKTILSDDNQSGFGQISDEMFERTMDMLEKAAYAKQRDHFTSDELEELKVGVEPVEVVKIIYEHWQEKRQKKGMPLIRHLQPPLWEKYQQQVSDWELAMNKSNIPLPNGCHDKAALVEKPPMFAFCLKPRGIEVPNKGSKQRMQKKFPVSGHNYLIAGDLDPFHSLGRRLNGYPLGDDKHFYGSLNCGSCSTSPLLQASTRLFSPRDEGAMGYFSLNSGTSERNYYPKLYQKKSKKIGTILHLNDGQMFSYNQRTMRGSNGVHGSNISPFECSSSMHYEPEWSSRHRIEQLDASDLDEFRLRDASDAARHAINMAKLKREKAQRLLYKADLAIHKAVVALTTAEAIKAALKEPNNDV